MGDPKGVDEDDYDQEAEREECPELSQFWRANARLPPTPSEELCECAVAASGCQVKTKLTRRTTATSLTSSARTRANSARPSTATPPLVSTVPTRPATPSPSSQSSSACTTRLLTTPRMPATLTARPPPRML